MEGDLLVDKKAFQKSLQKSFAKYDIPDPTWKTRPLTETVQFF